MTRPRGEATRRRLLDEAIKQFGRGGYEGTSLESVAGAAGVRKQTLLYYFPSKEALLEACIGKTSERVAAALSEALEAESSSSRKAEAVIHTIFRLAEEWPEFPQFVREAGRLGPDVVERFLAAMNRPGSQPAFIHCAGGGRAATLWMIKRVKMDGWDRQRAIDEATALGMASERLKQFAINYLDTHKG